jgi:hypothetical protein
MAILKHKSTDFIVLHLIKPEKSGLPVYRGYHKKSPLRERANTAQY